MSQPIKPRLKFFVNRRFQLHFIALVFAPIILSAAIMYASKEFMFREKVSLGEQLGLPADHGYYELLKYHQSIENQMIFFSFFASALIFLAWSIFISHRIAGPIYRVTETLKNAKPNEGLKPIHFRPSDFFQEIPEALNGFLDKNNLTKKD